jgi:hypothetical protein
MFLCHRERERERERESERERERDVIGVYSFLFHSLSLCLSVTFFSAAEKRPFKTDYSQDAQECVRSGSSAAVISSVNSGRPILSLSLSLSLSQEQKGERERKREGGKRRGREKEKERERGKEGKERNQVKGKCPRL